MGTEANHRADARQAWLVYRCDNASARPRPNLLVGLAGDRGVLLWQGPLPAGDRAVASAGGANRQRVDYFVAGLHHVDFPAGAEVPVDQVFAAVAEFLVSGQRPTRVAWQAD